MDVPAQLAKHLQEVTRGGNWTGVNLTDTLNGIDYTTATKKMDGFNSIAALVFHIGYYAKAILAVLQKEPLNAHDKYSFDHPPLTSAADWEQLRDQCLANLETLAAQIRLFPADQLGETFVDEKYGTYLRNFMGLIEHTHYHLGQIVMIRKMINEKALG